MKVQGAAGVLWNGNRDIGREARQAVAIEDARHGLVCVDDDLKSVSSTGCSRTPRPSSSSSSPRWLADGAERLCRAAAMRVTHSSKGPGSAVSCGATADRSRSPVSEMATVRSAGTAAADAKGSGSTSPPSTRSRSLTVTGVKIPGRAIDARIATSTAPRRNQPSRPASRSVATAVNGTAAGTR